MLKTAASSVAEATPSAAPASVARAIESSCPSRGVVWIDLDNSPHVPFFVPIIHQLEARGYSVLLTARDCFQVAELAKLHNLKCETIGRHYGKNSLLKIWGLFVRAAQLLPIALRHRPALAVSHGSRGQLLISWLLRIPTLQMGDYEFAKGWVLINPTWEMKPDIIPALAGRSKPGRVLLYPGIKEDVYVPDFCPDPTLRSQLGLSESDVVVTVRPPASEAHYHDQRSDELFRAVMDYLAGQPEVRIIVLPRNDRQATAIGQMWPAIFATRKATIPEQVVDGL